MTTPRGMNDLFAAARADAPSDAVREAIFHRVLVTSAVAPAAAAATATTAAVAGGTKTLLGIGGAVLAAGVSVAIALARPAAPPVTSVTPAAVAVRHAPAQHVVAGGARLADPLPRARASLDVAPSASAPVAIAPLPAAHVAVADDASSLAEEARLVTEARQALVRGEPERALALVHTTRALPTRALEPEELGLEARALRALGRSDEALATELTLRRRFPGHALAR